MVSIFNYLEERQLELADIVSSVLALAPPSEIQTQTTGMPGLYLARPLERIYI